MILTGTAIKNEVQKGNIIIEPFNSQNLNPNSYDLTLGNTFLKYTANIIDPTKENKYQTIKINYGEKIHLDKGDFVLASSVERIGSEIFVPIIHNKSSIARLGLFIHITADLIDMGSIGNITFQLYATLPIILTPGIKIGQVSFREAQGEKTLYQGKYQNSNGPIASKSYL